MSDEHTERLDGLRATVADAVMRDMVEAEMLAARLMRVNRRIARYRAEMARLGSEAAAGAALAEFGPEVLP